METKIPTNEEIRKYYTETYGYAGYISHVSNGSCGFRTCSWNCYKDGINKSRQITIEDINKIIIDRMIKEKNLFLAMPISKKDKEVADILSKFFDIIGIDLSEDLIKLRSNVE